jgi:hypothetical protein
MGLVVLKSEVAGLVGVEWSGCRACARTEAEYLGSLLSSAPRNEGWNRVSDARKGKQTRFYEAVTEYIRRRLHCRDAGSYRILIVWARKTTL